MKFLTSLILILACPSYSETLTLDHARTGVKTSINIDPNFIEGTGQQTLIEFKSFYCGPCKILKERVDPVKAYYQGTNKIRFGIKLGAIRAEDRPVSATAFCAMKSGGLLHTLVSMLYENPTYDTNSLKLVQMLDAPAFDSCMSQGLGNRYFDAELKDVQTIGIQFFPTVYLNGKKIPTPTSPEALIDLIGR